MRASSTHHTTAFVWDHLWSYASLSALLLTFTLVVAACTGSVKPVPTQESQEASPSPIPATTEAPKPAEPGPSEPPASPSTAPSLPVPPLGAAPPSESDKTEETPVLETQPVLVTAQRESYTVQHSATATRTETSIMETPVNIQVVPQQVLKDQQAIRLERATQNVSGVYLSNQTQGQPVDEFVIRGFPSNFTTYRDWFPLGQAGGFTGKRDVANLERIEILKGPASILFGRIEPGASSISSRNDRCPCGMGCSNSNSDRSGSIALTRM